MRPDSKSIGISKKPKKFQINRGQRLSKTNGDNSDSSDDEPAGNGRRGADLSDSDAGKGDDDNEDLALFNKNTSKSKLKQQ